MDDEWDLIPKSAELMARITDEDWHPMDEPDMGILAEWVDVGLQSLVQWVKHIRVHVEEVKWEDVIIELNGAAQALNITRRVVVEKLMTEQDKINVIAAKIQMVTGMPISNVTPMNIGGIEGLGITFEDVSTPDDLSELDNG
jgi:hypothetical protein